MLNSSISRPGDFYQRNSNILENIFYLANLPENQKWLVPSSFSKSKDENISPTEAVEIGASLSLMLLSPSFGGVDPRTATNVLPLGTPSCTKLELFLIPRGEADKKGLRGDGYIVGAFRNDPRDIISACRFVCNEDASEILVYTWSQGETTIVSWFSVNHFGMERVQEHLEYDSPPSKDIMKERPIRRVRIEEKMACPKCSTVLLDCACPKISSDLPTPLVSIDFRNVFIKKFSGIFDGQIYAWIDTRNTREEQVSGESKCIFQASSLARRNAMKIACLKILRERETSKQNRVDSSEESVSESNVNMMKSQDYDKFEVSKTTVEFGQSSKDSQGSGPRPVNRNSLTLLLEPQDEPLLTDPKFPLVKPPLPVNSSNSSEDRAKKVQARAERNRELARVSNEKRRIRIQGMEAELSVLRGTLSALQNQCRILQNEKDSTDYENATLRQVIEMNNVKFNDEMIRLRNQCDNLQRLNINLQLENVDLKNNQNSSGTSSG